MDFRGQTEPRNLAIAGVVSDGRIPLPCKEEGSTTGEVPQSWVVPRILTKIRPRQSLISLSGIIFC